MSRAYQDTLKGRRITGGRFQSQTGRATTAACGPVPLSKIFPSDSKGAFFSSSLAETCMVGCPRRQVSEWDPFTFVSSLRRLSTLHVPVKISPGRLLMCDCSSQGDGVGCRDLYEGVTWAVTLCDVGSPALGNGQLDHPTGALHACGLEVACVSQSIDIEARNLNDGVKGRWRSFCSMPDNVARRNEQMYLW